MKTVRARYDIIHDGVRVGPRGILRVPSEIADALVAAGAAEFVETDEQARASIPVSAVGEQAPSPPVRARRRGE